MRLATDGDQLENRLFFRGHALLQRDVATGYRLIEPMANREYGDRLGPADPGGENRLSAPWLTATAVSVQAFRSRRTHRLRVALLGRPHIPAGVFRRDAH